MTGQWAAGLTLVAGAALMMGALVALDVWTSARTVDASAPLQALGETRDATLTVLEGDVTWRLSSRDGRWRAELDRNVSGGQRAGMRGDDAVRVVWSIRCAGQAWVVPTATGERIAATFAGPLLAQVLGVPQPPAADAEVRTLPGPDGGYAARLTGALDSDPAVAAFAAALRTPLRVGEPLVAAVTAGHLHLAVNANTSDPEVVAKLLDRAEALAASLDAACGG